jgi:molybdenum cofactor biosynthesis enzyme
MVETTRKVSLLIQWTPNHHAKKPPVISSVSGKSSAEGHPIDSARTAACSQPKTSWKILQTRHVLEVECYGILTQIIQDVSSLFPMKIAS